MCEDKGNAASSTNCEAQLAESALVSPPTLHGPQHSSGVHTLIGGTHLPMLSGDSSPTSEDSGVHMNGDSGFSAPVSPVGSLSPGAPAQCNGTFSMDSGRMDNEDGCENGSKSRHDSAESSDEHEVIITKGARARESTDASTLLGEMSTEARSSLLDTDDVVLIQDTTFTVKISVPGCDLFDLQVSSMELVQEIHQVLMDREDSCHRTCFSLQLNGQSLDNFTELKNIEGMKEGVILKVVEEPYTVREARIHLRHVRDLIKSLDLADAFNGSECASLSFLNTITSGNILERRKMKLESSVDCTPPDFILPGAKERLLTPLMPVSKDMLNIQCLKVLGISGWNPPPGNRKLRGDLMYLYVLTLEDKRYHVTASTKGFFVNLSTEDEFNPKAASQKFIYHSLVDLLNYISPSFKKNFALIQRKRCSKHPFERVATPYQLFTWTATQFEHSVDCIRAEDAFAFKLGYEEHIPGQQREWNEELQTTRELPKKSVPERLLRERAIFKVHSDFVSAATRGAVAVVDGNVMAINPGEESKMQMFIWNNIFFSLGFDVKDHYKDLGGDAAAFVAPSNDLQGVRAYFALDPEGLYVLGTVVIDYRGYRLTAQSIIPGILERDQEQSVVYGSVDFGKTVVSSDKYQQLLAKPAQQLKILPHTVKSANGESVKLFSSFESKGIVGNDSRHYILDLLRTFPPDVNFLQDADVTPACKQNGFPRKHRHKLACLRQELTDAFVEARYVTFIKIAAFHLQRLRLRQLTERQTSCRAEATSDVAASPQTSADYAPCTVVECGTEEQLTPTQEQQQSVLVNGDAQDSAETEELVGSVIYRNERSRRLLAADTTPLLFGDAGGSEDGAAIVARIREKISREPSPGKDEDLPETDEARRIMESLTEARGETLEQTTKEIIRKAAQAVGSLSDTEFDVRFNPDCYSPGVVHDECEDLDRQRRLVQEAAQFLLTSQIPGFIRDCLEHNCAPFDGIALTELLHARGINMRYLGTLLQLIDNIPMLDYLRVICFTEVLCRSAKHIFRLYLQSVEQTHLCNAVAHFLNCFFGACAQAANGAADEVLVRKRSKKSKRGGNGCLLTDSVEWASLTSKSLWQQLRDESDSYFGFVLDCDSMDAAVDSFGVCKLPVLRRLCLICGVQLVLRDYALDSRVRPPFQEEDVNNLFPVVKHINPKASDACNFYTTGQAKIQQGQLRAGYELVTEALNLLNNVYGACHPEIAQCLRLLARLAYILGDHTEALAQQQKAVLMSERCNGIDHPHTVLEYTHMALYAFANWQIGTALKLLYRARYLMLIAHGENHPHVALLDSNIGLILHAVGEYDLSVRYLEHSLQLNARYFGRKSLKVALSYHLIARTQSCRGDFRTALQYEKETFNVYKDVLGDEHEKTKESGECLRHLTQQAVSLQKRMNEITRNSGSVSQILPLQIQQPSFTNVLEVLNIVNGICFIQLSPKEMEALRVEMGKSPQGAADDMGL